MRWQPRQIGSHLRRLGRGFVGGEAWGGWGVAAASGPCAAASASPAPDLAALGELPAAVGGRFFGRRGGVVNAVTSARN